jgi:hypothetical protein
VAAVRETTTKEEEFMVNVLFLHTCDMIKNCLFFLIFASNTKNEQIASRTKLVLKQLFFLKDTLLVYLCFFFFFSSDRICLLIFPVSSDTCNCVCGGGMF